MISYQVNQTIALKWLALSLGLLAITYFAREIDLIRQVCAIGAIACYLIGIVYVIFCPTLLGNFIKVYETQDGFNIEYLNKDGNVKQSDKIVIRELVNFSYFDHSSRILTQSRFVFRFANRIIKLTLLHKKKVRGTELQTAEIIDQTLQQISKFNSQKNNPFIERVPSFFSSEKGFYISMIIIMIFAGVIIFSPVKTEKIIIGMIMISMMAAVIILRRNKELRGIRKSNQRL